MKIKFKHESSATVTVNMFGADHRQLFSIFLLAVVQVFHHYTVQWTLTERAPNVSLLKNRQVAN